MQSEQSILLVGCEVGAFEMMRSALNRVGFHVSGAEFDDFVLVGSAPDCVIFYLTSENCGSVRRFLSQSALVGAKRIAILDPRDRLVRGMAEEFGIQELIYKPVPLSRLVTSIGKVFGRTYAQGTDNPLCDIAAFQRYLNQLASHLFTGCLSMDGNGQNARIYLKNGSITGVECGKKQQQNAESMLWRMFPVTLASDNETPVPEWADALFDIDDMIAQIRETTALFRKLFGSEPLFDAVYRVSGIAYECAIGSLPRQVQRIVHRFDGTRTVAQIFDSLNIDDSLMLRITSRLINDGILVPAVSDSQSQVSFLSWINRDADASGDQAVVAPAEFADTDNSGAFEAPTKSAIFYALSPDAPNPASQQEDSGTQPKTGAKTADHVEPRANPELSKTHPTDALVGGAAQENVEYDDDDDDYDEDDYDDEADREQERWAIAQYKKNHGNEMSPEAWKKLMLQRLREQNRERNRHIIRMLGVAILVIIFAIFVVLLYKMNRAMDAQIDDQVMMRHK